MAAKPTWEEMYWMLNDKYKKRLATAEAERDRLKAENERLLRCLADYPAGNQTEPDAKAALREVDGGKV